MAEAQPNHKIVLIEDDAAMQAVLRTLLEIEGFAVTVPPAAAGLAALLESVRAVRPGVVLLDVHLRQLNGLEVLRAIREDGDVCSTRVVMCSGMDMSDACLQSGADAFLMKPYMPDELLEKLAGQP